MKKINKGTSWVLLILGLALLVFSQVFSQYVQTSDVTRGLCTGLGVGALILSLLFGKFKAA